MTRLPHRHPYFVPAVLGVSGLGMTALLLPMAWESCTVGALPHTFLPAFLALTLAGYVVYLSGTRRTRLGLWVLSAGHLLLALTDLNTVQQPLMATLSLMWGASLFGLRGVVMGLAALYFFGGLGKLSAGGVLQARALSTAFGDNGLIPDLTLLALLPGGIIELALAALLLLGRVRSGALIMAAVHLGVLVLMIKLDRAVGIWPWNLQLLILAGVLYKSPAFTPQNLRQVWPVTAVMGAAGALSLLGLFPSALHYNLYGRTPPAVMVQGPGGSWTNVGVGFVKRTRFVADSSPLTVRTLQRCAEHHGLQVRVLPGEKLLPWLPRPWGR